MGRMWLVLGCLFGGLTVLLGAFAAHGLKGELTEESMLLFEIATRYMMIHGFALFALGFWSYVERWTSTFWPGLFFVAGIIGFSGSLYALAFIEVPWLVYVTPAGGVSFLLGWLTFAFSILSTRNRFM